MCVSSEEITRTKRKSMKLFPRDPKLAPLRFAIDFRPLVRRFTAALEDPSLWYKDRRHGQQAPDDKRKQERPADHKRQRPPEADTGRTGTTEQDTGRTGTTEQALESDPDSMGPRYNPEGPDPGTIQWDEKKGVQMGGPGALLWLTVLAVLTTAATAMLIYDLFKGAIDIMWNMFPNLPSDSDRIDVALSDGTADSLTVVMTLGPNVSWWKAAELYDAQGRMLGSAWCKRDEGVVTNSTTVKLVDLAGGFLVLKKAKMFGVHTSMYVLRWESLSSRAGRTVEFVWNAD
jgi:hypothetical protein